MELFENHDLLFEFLIKVDYPTLIKICSSNKKINKYCKEQNTPILQKRFDNFLRYKSTINALIDASKLGDLPIVDQLMKQGINPAIFNNSALVYAIRNGHTYIVRRILLDSRVRLDYEMVYEAVCLKFIPIIYLLLADSRIEPYIDFLLNLSISNKLSEVIDYILIHHQNLKFWADQFRNSIILSIQEKNRDLFDLLLSKQKFNEIKSIDSFNAIVLEALKGGDIDTIKYILTKLLATPDIDNNISPQVKTDAWKYLNNV